MSAVILSSDGGVVGTLAIVLRFLPEQQQKYIPIANPITAAETPIPIPTFSRLYRYPLGSFKDAVGMGTTVDSAALKRIWIGVAVMAYSVRVVVVVAPLMVRGSLVFNGRVQRP